MTNLGLLKKSLRWRTGFLTRFKDTEWLPPPGNTGKNAHAPLFQQPVVNRLYFSAILNLTHRRESRFSAPASLLLTQPYFTTMAIIHHLEQDFTMPPTPDNNRAFTLIELLIVVAIIAILAAIAVPNFLEAQIRSKVARTQSDMRTMTVAVESYHVDFNQYPLPVAVMNDDFSVVYPMPSPNHNLYAQNFLPQTITTPTAYLTTIFTDVFANPTLEPSPEQQYIYYQNWEYTRRLADAAGAAFTPPQTLRSNAFGLWIMSAGGPDLDRKDLSPTAVGPTNLINGVYNATNGTVSNGDIIRTQRNPSGFSL